MFQKMPSVVQKKKTIIITSSRYKPNFSQFWEMDACNVRHNLTPVERLVNGHIMHSIFSSMFHSVHDLEHKACKLYLYLWRHGN